MGCFPIIFAFLVNLFLIGGQGYITYLCSVAVFENYYENPIGMSMEYNWTFTFLWNGVIGMNISLIVSGVYLVTAIGEKSERFQLNCDSMTEVVSNFSVFLQVIMIVAFLASTAGWIIFLIIAAYSNYASIDLYSAIIAFIITSIVVNLAQIFSIPSISASMLLNRFINFDDKENLLLEP
ncbi:MAG: hypothetical protein Hyperionvirus1_164 [Hyperionvirus sp.]|uniref:Uncharacterized protein n=1 Tax=Hyperionvirus sp. TaxID=2487770 RepID=A0A3G5A5R2_9VIRU|nr:MAG: hypothetical protein Hyperionvirus1_164 [Hyperionvirus sp.]